MARHRIEKFCGGPFLSVERKVQTKAELIIPKNQADAYFQHSASRNVTEIGSEIPS